MRYLAIALLILLSPECLSATSGSWSQAGKIAHGDLREFKPAVSSSGLLNQISMPLEIGVSDHLLTGHDGYLPVLPTVSPYAALRTKDIYQRKARGKTIFIVNMSLAGGFGALATWAGVRGKKKEDFESSFATTLTAVGLGMVGTGHLILGMGVGLPLWQAKGKEKTD